MPELGYEETEHDHSVAVPSADKKKRIVYPELIISGKNIKLAKLEQLGNVGTELQCTVTLVLEEAKIEDDVSWDTADEWKNRFNFKVKTLYVDDLIGGKKPESDQEKFEKGLIGVVLPKKKTMSKEDAMPKY